MPWTVNDSRIRSLPKEGRSLWVRVANGYLDEHPGEDVSAIRIAWSAVGNAGYKKAEGEHKWSLSGTRESVDNLTKHIHPFGGAPVTFAKAYTKGGKRYVTVKASGLKVDRQDERMMPSAIEDMVAACKAGKVDLLDNHFSSFEMGKSTDANVDEHGDMFVEFCLKDEHPNTDQLYKEIEAGKCTRQASVGGNVTDSEYEYDGELGKAVKKLKRVDLDHIAVTREGHSAYPDAAFVGAIAKQVHLGVVKNQGGSRMEKLKMLIAELQKAAAMAVELQKGAFQVTPEMFGDDFVLKPEFQKSVADAKVTLSKEDMAVVSASMSSVLKVFGVPTIRKSYGTIKDMMAAHKEAATTHKEAMDAHDKFKEHMDAYKEAMEDGEADPAKAKTHLQAAMDAHGELCDKMDAHKEAMDNLSSHFGKVKKSIDGLGSEDQDKGTDSSPDSGTGKDGKEEKRPKKDGPKAEDGADHDELAGGPGTDKPHQGNGSVDQMKAVAASLVKKLEVELTGKLTKAKEELDTVKKDAHATKEQLIKSTLQVSELQKNIAQLKAQPAAPRPGSGQKVEKSVASTDGRAVHAITKAMTEDPNGWMQKLQGEVDQLVKLKGTRSWNETLAKEAETKAAMLKMAITAGPLVAMEMYGIKEEEVVQA